MSDSRSPTHPRFWTNLGAFVGALVVVALGAAGFAIAFRFAIQQVFTRAYGAPDVLTAFTELPWYACLLVPALGGVFAGWLSQQASRLKGGRGLGEVMEAVVLGSVHISLRATLLKALGSLLAIVSGGSIGREGSIIQFGGGLGGAAGGWLGLREGQVRSLVAAGSAAGFAAAYNTPLAAVLFVVEVVTGVIALDVVLPAIIAVPIATHVTRLALGGGPIYGLQTVSMAPGTVVLPVVLGLLAGLAGPAFMALLSRGEAWFGKVPLPKPLRAGLGGLLVGAMALRLPQITGNGYEGINLILSGDVGVLLMLALLLAKPIATTASVSSGSPGGVFTPSLVIGASLGGALGYVASFFYTQPVTQLVPAFALLGMAALTAATTHAPVMAAVLVFELTGDYAIVLPLLITTATATLLSRRLRHDSIYSDELRRHGTAWDITIEGRRLRPPE